MFARCLGEQQAEGAGMSRTSRTKGPGHNPDDINFAELAMARTDRAILISDAERSVRYINPAFTELFGYSFEDVTGTNPWELLAGPMTDARLHMRAKGGQERPEGWHDDLLLRTKTGDPVWVSAKIEAVFNAQGTFEYVVAMLADITQTKRLQMLQREVIEQLLLNVPLEALMHQICTQVETMAPDVVCSILRVDDD